MRSTGCGGIGYHQRAYQGGTDVWLTPPDLLAKLGEFDLDPCAPLERPWDTAKHHFTIDDDGLMQTWFGRVWLNPPYGPKTKVWLERMAAHGVGTALIFARTETDMFFRFVWEKASAVLFLRGRLTFHLPNGMKADKNGGAPSVLIAYGSRDRDILAGSGIRGQFINLRD